MSSRTARLENVFSSRMSPVQKGKKQRLVFRRFWGIIAEFVFAPGRKTRMERDKGRFLFKPQKKTIAPTQITPVKKAIEKNFNKNLYHDIEDVFSRNHSQRQFYTVPSTGVPNDQEEFAKWLYRKEPTCKENKETCDPKW